MDMLLPLKTLKSEINSNLYCLRAVSHHFVHWNFQIILIFTTKIKLGYIQKINCWAAFKNEVSSV